MNDSAAQPPPLFAPKWALVFGVALLAAFAVVVILAGLDRRGRERLESTAETTAVGDVRFFIRPLDPQAYPVAGATWEGQALVVASGEELDVRDTHLRRAGFDSSNGLTIYELSAAASDAERERVAKSGGRHLLKLAPNDYVSARAAGP